MTDAKNYLKICEQSWNKLDFINFWHTAIYRSKTNFNHPTKNDEILLRNLLHIIVRFYKFEENAHPFYFIDKLLSLEFYKAPFKIPDIFFRKVDKGLFNSCLDSIGIDKSSYFCNQFEELLEYSEQFNRNISCEIPPSRMNMISDRFIKEFHANPQLREAYPYLALVDCIKSQFSGLEKNHLTLENYLDWAERDLWHRIEFCALVYGIDPESVLENSNVKIITCKEGLEKKTLWCSIQIREVEKLNKKILTWKPDNPWQSPFWYVDQILFRLGSDRLPTDLLETVKIKFLKYIKRNQSSIKTYPDLAEYCEVEVFFINDKKDQQIAEPSNVLSTPNKYPDKLKIVLEETGEPIYSWWKEVAKNMLTDNSHLKQREVIKEIIKIYAEWDCAYPHAKIVIPAFTAIKRELSRNGWWTHHKKNVAPRENRLNQDFLEHKQKSSLLIS